MLCCSECSFTPEECQEKTEPRCKRAHCQNVAMQTSTIYLVQETYKCVLTQVHLLCLLWHCYPWWRFMFSSIYHPWEVLQTSLLVTLSPKSNQTHFQHAKCTHRYRCGGDGPNWGSHAENILVPFLAGNSDIIFKAMKICNCNIIECMLLDIQRAITCWVELGLVVWRGLHLQ